MLRYIIISLGLVFSGPATLAQDAPNPLAFLAGHEGDWTVSGRMMTQGGWMDTQPQPASIESLYEGRAYVETSQVDFGAEVSGLTTLISYDVFREIYRVAAVDEGYGLLDVYEGNFDEEGRLVVDNLRADTFFPAGPSGQLHFQLRWTFIDENSYVFEVLMTPDRGENWRPYFELSYARDEQE